MVDRTLPLACCHAIVTGAAGSIGRSVVERLAGDGAFVDAIDIIDNAEFNSDQVKYQRCDLTATSGLDAIVEDTSGPEHSTLALVNVAALIKRQRIDEITPQDWDDQMSVNAKASFFLARALWHQCRARSLPGRIVNFSSQGWHSGGYDGSVVYAATKGAVTTMTRGLAREFAADNVTVNVIAPGIVDTPMVGPQLMGEDRRQALVDAVPLQRFAEPDEIAGTVAFLLSDDAAYYTGATFNISGGFLMY